MVMHSIDELSEERMAALQMEGLYVSARWLRYCERAPGSSMMYVGLEDRRGRLQGLCALRRVADPRTMDLYNIGSLIIEEPEQAPFGVFPNLVAAVSGAHCVLLLPPVERHDRDVLLQRLVEAIAEVARSEGYLTIGFLYLQDRADADVVAAALGSERPFLVDLNTELVCDADDFEGYLMSLPSKSRAKRRRERRRFLDSGLQVSVEHGTARLDERTAALQLQLREKYGVSGSIEQILADYASLRATVEDDIRVFLCSRDGKPIGLTMCLLDGERMHVRLSGFEYSALGSDFVYFNTTFYEPISWGLAHGIRTFVFGTGTYSAKAERGCRLLPSYGVVRWPSGLELQAQSALSERDGRLRELAGYPVVAVGD
ncbi:hypothetical protein AWB96_15600 [Mycobacteroides chelonae]|nr:hypothetical protein BKG56_15360 [Mycobacteroides chelonae]ORV12800.1 hypothetical protein AWB96_15600 [Mycobacteroides chelonae]